MNKIHVPSFTNYVRLFESSQIQPITIGELDIMVGRTDLEKFATDSEFDKFNFKYKEAVDLIEKLNKTDGFSKLPYLETYKNYNNWRLPTLDELIVIYNLREKIGGFETDKYWTSDHKDNYTIKTLSFDTGNLMIESIDSDFNRVRLVRDI